jgi:hypothetical protein
MASDKRKFERALRKWNQLHEDKAYSAPKEIGKTAIFCSTYELESNQLEHETAAALKFEANQLFRIIVNNGQRVTLIDSGTGNDLDVILKDPSISSVITIGHGALPYIYTSYGDRENTIGDRYTWNDVSKAADHLKTGYFEQRQCGNATYALSVPMGAFAMVSHSHVWAAANDYFVPLNLSDEENYNIIPVTSADCLTYEEIQRDFPYQSIEERSAVEI